MADESLPSGWVKKFHDKKQKHYYVNTVTKETQWNPPLETGDPQPEHPETKASQFEEGFSVKHNRKFWKNTQTGEIVWKDPNKSKKNVDDSKSANPSNRMESAESEWVEAFSEKHKRKFWRNKATGETVWKDPTQGQANITSAKVEATTLIPESDWKECFSEKHQRKFWRHKTSGEIVWKDPNEGTVNAAINNTEGDGSNLITF